MKFDFEFIAMPGHDNCVVPGCPNRRDRCKWGLFPGAAPVAGRVVYVKRRLCGSELSRKGCENAAEICKSVSFFRLPGAKRQELRKVWCTKIPRTNTPRTENSRVCSDHFENGSKAGDAVPSRFEGGPVTTKRKTRTSLAAETLPLSDSSEEEEVEGSGDEGFILPIVDPLFEPAVALAANDDPKGQEEQLKVLQGRLADLEKVLFHTRRDLQESKEIVEKLKFFFLKLSKEEKNFHFFTGITVQTFRDILAILGDSVHSMMYSADVPDDHEGKKRSQRSIALSVEDELLMTLVKLRHDFPESDLAARFDISQPTVSRIFSAWIRCMYHAFREIDIWPSRSLVDAFMPDSFRQKYPSTRVIIDATEFHIEKPANPDVQASTWSNYKNTNTLKLLVGVTPNGVISFLSNLWGGRISDKELTKRSKLLEKLEHGDSIMADRGFDIGSIMPEGTNVNIPPFLGGRPQFEADELVTTRRIASLRIHVERAMERIKNFRITHFIPANFCPLAQPIVHVCAFLTIFLSPLVPTPLHPSMIPSVSPASSALACVAVASTSPLACSSAVASGPESTALPSISPADELPVTGSSTTLPVPEGVPQLQAPRLQVPRLQAPQSLSSGERPTQHDGVCLQCAHAEPPLLRVCKTYERRYHHMCQSMDEEGHLCDHCFVRR